ncbi:MAG: ribonuclease R, partial [Candidimonas sp.]
MGSKSKGMGVIDVPPDFDPDVPSREVILQYLRAGGKKALAPEKLARALGAVVPLSVGFERRLKAMERDGQLVFTDQGRVGLNERSDFISGRVQG